MNFVVGILNCKRSRLSFTWHSPQTTNPLYKLLHALPLPSLARKDAFLNDSSSEAFPEKIPSRCIRHFATAPKPEAELAIPELCGNVFSVLIMYFPFKIQGRYCSILLKYFSIFAANFGSSLPAKKSERKMLHSL